MRRMIIALILAFYLLTGICFAETVSWSASPSPNVTGYKIYQRLASESEYGPPIIVGNVLSYTFPVTSTVPVLVAISAVTLTGIEGPKTVEVLWTPPTPPDPRIAPLESATTDSTQKLAAIKREVCTLKTLSTVRDALRRALGGC